MIDGKTIEMSFGFCYVHFAREDDHNSASFALATSLLASAKVSLVSAVHTSVDGPMSANEYSSIELHVVTSLQSQSDV